VADTIQTLLVSLEARIAGYEREMKRAVGIANRNANSIETRFKTMNRNLSNTMNGIGRTIGAAFAGAAALQGAQSLIDASTRIENSLKVAGLAGEELTQVYNSLRDAALQNAAPFESLVTLYGRVALVQDELGVSTEQLTGFANNVALALRVSGQSSSEASGALMQLSQALGSGTVRAEEFSSILEGAPTILQAAAAGIVEAEGSVAKLRAIMLEGNLSSKALFDGFAAGAVILEEKVAGSTLTVSQGFENLNTRLIDLAGRFDNATNISRVMNSELESLGQGVEELATFLENIIGPVQTFVGGIQTGIDKVNELSNAIAQITGLERIGFDAAVATNNLTGGAGLSGNSSAAGRVVDQTFSLIGATPEDNALAAIMAGKAEPAPLKVVVDGANPISINDPQYKPPASSGGSGAGGTKQSPGEKFDDILAKQAEENRLLAEKTALQATLNPLVNDYGFAIEKLNVAQELQSAATAAGLELTPALRQSIEELSAGYANASVEAAKLAESQDQLKQISAQFGEAGNSAIKGFISDLREGKSAADALSNAMSSILDSVIEIGLNAILGGGGGGLGSLIGGLFGFAGGGYTGNGGKNEPAGVVHKGEYVFTKAQTEKLGVGNLSRLARGYANGGLVGAPGPVASRGGVSGLRITVGVDVDSSGNLMPFVTEVADSRVAKAAPAIGGAAVRTSNKQAGPAAGEYSARFGTG